MTLGAEFAENMIVKVIEKNVGKRVQHTLQTMSETFAPVQERKFIFKLDKPKNYMIILEYSGDMFNEHMEEDPCGYFDLTISINSMKSLKKTLSCSGQPGMDKIHSIL